MNRTPFAETERAAPRSHALGARAAGAGPLASTPAWPRRAPLLVAAALVALGLALRPTRGAAPSGPAGNPLLGLTRSAADREPLVGRVVERLVAGSYTYVAIEGDDGRRAWAVTLGRGAPEGARARVRSFGRSSNFFSARLQRTFPELIFGTLTRLD
ncbi:MAG: hypothetical protein MUF34_17375 [Polyangiaceae bacterium]|nr:hypothetical protein [Polyangiaceae bacterium]